MLESTVGIPERAVDVPKIFIDVPKNTSSHRKGIVKCWNTIFDI